MKRTVCLSLIMSLIILFSFQGLIISAYCDYTYTGFTLDEYNNPIVNATIMLVTEQNNEFSLELSSNTNISGQFEITTLVWGDISAYKQSDETPGFDYYISSSAITGERFTVINGKYIQFRNITLVPAATIRLIGEFKSIKSDIRAFYPLFIHQDTDLLKKIGEYEEIPFEYQRIINRQLLELDSQTIIAPAGIEFYLELHGYTKEDYAPTTSSAKPPSYSISTKLYDSEPFLLGQGEIYEYNIRNICLHQDLDDIVELQSDTHQELLEAKTGGYNANDDEERLHSSEDKTSQAAEALIEEDYDSAYNNLTEANNLLLTIIENIEAYENSTSTGIPGFPLISLILGLTIGLILSKKMKISRHRV